MRMLCAISAAAAVLAAAPVIAAEPAEVRFEHDGYTYVYKAEVRNRRKVITGHRFPGNTPFRLVVSGQKVRGVTGGAPVSFRLSEVERLDDSERLVMR